MPMLAGCRAPIVWPTSGGILVTSRASNTRNTSRLIRGFHTEPTMLVRERGKHCMEYAAWPRKSRLCSSTTSTAAQPKARCASPWTALTRTSTRAASTRWPSAPGHGRTGTRSRIAGGCPLTSSRSTRRQPYLPLRGMADLVGSVAERQACILDCLFQDPAPSVVAYVLVGSRRRAGRVPSAHGATLVMGKLAERGSR
jgi:hypothetical protein